MPAIASSACKRVRLEPERAAHVRHDSRRSVLDRSRAPHHQDQRDHRDDAEDADADMRRAPAVADDEMLHDRRPDGARKIIAAGCNADRDATPLLEPVRHVGDDRTERRRRAGADHHMGGVEHPDVRRIAGADVADRKQHRAEDCREDDAVTIGKPAHRRRRRTRSRSSPSCRGARRHCAGCRSRPAPAAARPHTTTCRRCRWCRAPARRTGVSRRKWSRPR